MLFDNIQGQALLLVSALTDMIGLLMFFSVLFVSILVTWKLLNLLNNQNSCRSTNGHITISIAWFLYVIWASDTELFHKADGYIQELILLTYLEDFPTLFMCYKVINRPLCLLLNNIIFNVRQSYCARYRYRLDVCPSVCLSVCLSVTSAGIVSKRLNLSSNCLHCLVAPLF